MNSLIFDTSSIISLSTNNLLWTLKELKKEFNGSFYVTGSVKKEVVDNPMHSKRFKLAALMIKDFIEEKNIEIYKKNPNVKSRAIRLLDIANRIFRVEGHYIKVLDLAEIESLQLAIYLKSKALVVDERTLRLLVENPTELMKILGGKLHSKVSIDEENLRKFQSEVSGVKIIRSIELMMIAFELKLLDVYITDVKFHKELKLTLLEAILWGLKLKGCSISESEINEIIDWYRKKITFK